ncbi:MAG: hypothetical protein ACYS99_07260 [Planctomycetota bacterium]|jgi:hypothetical protein
MYRRIRIPLPPRRTWFRRRSRGYKVKGLEDPGPRARRLRGGGHARALRDEAKGHVRLRRSRVRWLLVVATWAALLWAALQFPLHHASFVHLATMLLALVAWPAAFSPNAANRGFASFLLLAGAAAYLLSGSSVAPGILGASAAGGLLAGSFAGRPAEREPVGGSPEA